MNTDPEFVQSPHRAIWPFPEPPAPDQRKPEPMALEPGWYRESQAAHAASEIDSPPSKREPEPDTGMEMLGAWGLVLIVFGVGAVLGYFAFLY